MDLQCISVDGGGGVDACHVANSWPALIIRNGARAAPAHGRRLAEGRRWRPCRRLGAGLWACSFLGLCSRMGRRMRRTRCPRTS